MPVFAVLAAIEEITSSAILSSVTASSASLAVVIALLANLSAVIVASFILVVVTASFAILSSVIAPSEILPAVIPADIVPLEIVIPLPAVRASCFPSICVCIADVTPST